MDTKLVLRLIELVKKTGDRLVLADPAGESAVVVMDLAEYEELLAAGKTESKPVEQLVAESVRSAPLPAPQPVPPTLTGEGSKTNIKPDIGNRKTVRSQDSKPTGVSQSEQVPENISDQPSVEPKESSQWTDEPEDEAKFYLEPIE